MQKVTWAIGMIVMMCFSAAAQQKDNQQVKRAKPITNTVGKKADSLENIQQGDGAKALGAESAADENDRAPGSGKKSERASNSPAVVQTNASDSGSPAILSKQNGRMRDGTNNVQRATMNMAGSPAGNVRIPLTRPEDPDKEMKDRQNYERAKETSANQQSTTDQNRSGNSNGANNRSRRENSAASDQNLSSKDRNKARKAEDQRSEPKGKKRSRR